jgi:hypothetical protein
MATTMAMAARSALVLSQKTAAQALPAAVVALATRGFATPGKKKASKKKSKKNPEDANFELMLRTVRGRYPETCVFLLMDLALRA